ncbi:MAG: hypothetical protein KF830_16690 [Planctomycetes bacterium]|nr:hypothetical protein [Planctomycetota bacterium]
MRRAFVRALAAGLLTAAVAAQETSGPADPELLRAQRQLQQNRSEVDRLVELRLRHDLGLPLETDGSEFRATGPASSADLDRARQELREQDAATASLLERYNRLKAQADQLHAEAVVRTSGDAAARQFVVVPPANAAQPRASGRGLPPAGAVTAPAAPAGEGRIGGVPAEGASATVAALDLGLGPIRGQVHGSGDHQRVAQALFKAGQALMDRAQALRDQGQADLARELDQRARERLVRAVDELGPLLRAPDPALPALFQLGRCRELLFRLAERLDGMSLAAAAGDYQRREQEVREPFLRIAARDVQRTGPRGEVEVLGPWGKAAQSAMEHFRWMNLHAGYDPRAAIEALTWPGERRP